MTREEFKDYACLYLKQTRNSIEVMSSINDEIQSHCDQVAEHDQELAEVLRAEWNESINAKKCIVAYLETRIG